MNAPGMVPSVHSVSERIETTQLMDNRSPFERLPRELAWMIFYYAHPSLSHLRSTSRSIQSQVREFAFRTTKHPIVDSVKFGRPNSPSHIVLVTLDLMKCLSPLFELRLRLLLSDCNLTSRVQRLAVPGVDGRWEYALTISSTDEDAVLTRLGQCIGGRIGTVIVSFLDEEPTLTVVEKILTDVTFEKMIYRTDELSEAEATFLTNTVESNKVERMALKVSRVACVEPGKLLLALSSHVRSLRVFQHSVIDMFGMEDRDWAELIVEMFLRKLDKLYMRNPAYAGFLGARGTQILVERLPTLGKPIWFETSCSVYESGADYIVNDHSIKADRSDYNFGPVLKIKHSTREKEEIDFYLA